MGKEMPDLYLKPNSQNFRILAEDQKVPTINLTQNYRQRKDTPTNVGLGRSIVRLNYSRNA